MAEMTMPVRSTKEEVLARRAGYEVVRVVSLMDSGGEKKHCELRGPDGSVTVGSERSLMFQLENINQEELF